MTKITVDEIQQLRAKFPEDTHSVRQGHGSSSSNNCSWYVYLDRLAIIDRLDDLFPGEWSYTMNDVQDRGTHFGAVGHLTIRGVTRSFNGTQLKEGTRNTPDNIEKGCGTDTFRRVASMWGIGAYLYKAPMIYTVKPEKGNWDQIRAKENEAMDKFLKWLRLESPVDRKPQKSGQNKGTRIPAKAENGKKEPVADDNEWSDSRLAKFIESMQTRFPEIDKTHPVILCKKMGIENFQVLGTRKKAWSKIMEYCYGNNYAVMVNWVRYFVVPEGEKGSNRLEFTADPIAKNGHGEIRAYGRSDKFKKLLDKIGDGSLYEGYKFNLYEDDKIAGITTDWAELEPPLILSYKTGGSKEYPYDTCTGVKLPEFAEIF